MRRYLFYILLGTLVCTYTHAQSFCHLVQDVGTHYEDTIESAGTYYYSAWTFDLPMDVYITSLDPNCSEPPQVWADLTCTPGVYDDPNVQELVRDTAKYGISVPMALGCETTFENGHYVHHLKLGKSYRNRLQLIGVDYNVQAYVKVVIPCAGAALMEQDTSSQACFKDARWLRLVDSTHVLAFDTLTSYIIPYKDWLTEADSMALYWEGTQDARMWTGEECEFQADVQHAWDYYDLPANGEIHLSKSMLTNAVRNAQDSAGFMYSRVVCPEEGRLFVRPLVPDLKGATLLRYNMPLTVTVNDTALYCFPTEWQTAEWIANTRKVVKMYLYDSPEAEAVDSFKFDLQDSTRRVLQWSKPEMNLIRKKASGALLYVRFDCSREEFKLTPYELTDASCFGTTLRVRNGVSMSTGRSSAYRFNYADWNGYPMEIKWETTDPNLLQNLYFADVCSYEPNYRVTYTNEHTVYRKQTNRGGQTWELDSATIASWAVALTPEGYFYVRMTAGGTITFTTTKPEEQDPEGEDPEDENPGEGGTTTGWFTIEPEIDCRKVIIDGQIYILRVGKTFTITGQAIKIE